MKAASRRLLGKHNNPLHECVTKAPRSVVSEEMHNSLDLIRFKNK